MKTSLYLESLGMIPPPYSSKSHAGAFRNHSPGRLPSSRLITKLRLTFIPRDSTSLTKIVKGNAQTNWILLQVAFCYFLFLALKRNKLCFVSNQNFRCNKDSKLIFLVVFSRFPGKLNMLSRECNSGKMPNALLVCLGFSLISGQKKILISKYKHF